MSKLYHVTIASLPDYDELVAEIYINNVVVGLLNQEMGVKRTLIEFGQQAHKFDLETFEEALCSKTPLAESKKTPTDR